MGADEGSGSIGERIVGARLAYGARRRKAFTQQELARMVGVSAGSVSQWESDTTKPAHEMYPVLAAALGVTAEWLAWGVQANAPAVLDLTNARALTEAELDRADVIAARDAVRPAARRKKPGGAA